MPSSYTRLIGCDRHAHITLLHAERRLPSSYSRTGCGGPSTPMGGSYVPPDQALLTYRLWGGGGGSYVPQDQAQLAIGKGIQVPILPVVEH